MANETNPLTGKVGLDVTEFKAGITSLNREIRVIESGFKATAAGLGDWSKSSEGLEMRMKALASEIEIQGKKVDATRQAYEQMAAEKGANSRAAQDLEIKLNKETETLNKMQRELNQSETELGQMNSETDKAAGGMNNLETQTRQAGSQMAILKGIASGLTGVLAGVGIGMAAVGGAAILAAVGIGKIVLGTAETADQLDELSQKTGISTTRLQELGYIGKISGVDIDTMSGSLSKMIRSMDAAATTPAGKAFAELGVATRDANGNLLDSQTVFENTIGALGKVQNETERDALAMNIFGKSALELNPLILMGADGMGKMAEQAHKVGAVMSEESVKASADLQDKLDSLKMGAQGLVGTLAGMLAPGLSAAADGFSGLLEQVTGVIKGFQQSPEVGQKMLGDLLAGITGQLPGLLATGLKIVQGLINGLLQALPVMLPMAVKIITQLVTFIVQALPMLIEAAAQIVLELVKAIVPLLPALVEAGIKVILELVNGISQALPELMPVIARVIAEISRIIAQNLPLLIEAGISLLTAIIQGLGLALPILIQQVPVIIQTLVDAFVVAWPRIQELGWQLLGQFALGMLNELTQLIIICQEILASIGKTFSDGINYMMTIGKSLVDGIWLGIQSKKKELMQNLINWMLDMIGAAKKAIGFGSPSKVFIELGQSMATGLGIGFADQIRGVERGIAGTMGRLGSNGMALAGGMAYNTQTVYNFGPVYYGGAGTNGQNNNGDNQVLRY